MLTGVISRLATARKNAGLSQKQVDRLKLWAEGTTALIEKEEVELSLRQFLLLCECYGVSSVWVLTGVNPFVDVSEIIRLAQNTRITRDDLDKLVDLLVTMPAEPNTIASPTETVIADVSQVQAGDWVTLGGARRVQVKSVTSDKIYFCKLPKGMSTRFMSRRGFAEQVEKIVRPATR